MEKTLAIFSPSQNAYSETFIQAHKKLPFQIKYYYGNTLPNSLEGQNILDAGLIEKVQRKLLTGFSNAEKVLLFSLKKEKVNCVLAEYGTTAADSLNVIKYLKLPLIIHFHGYDASSRETIEAYKIKYKAVFEYASKVLVVSKKMYNDLLDLGCSKDKLLINCYGPDESFFGVSPVFTNQQFVAIGRFVEKKAPHLVIAAFEKVVEAFPDAKLVMAGDGLLLAQSKSLAKSLGLKDSITFPGALNRGQVQQLFSNSIAFVQHSVIAESGDSEGTPVAILEAQAAGLPVISTYHAGIPDVVINEVTGLLVEENDMEGMAKNMIRILNEKGLAEKLGVAGRGRLRDCFNMDKHLGILTNLIEQANTI